MWTICKIKSFENKFILERVSPRGQVLSCLVQGRRINGELGRLGFHSRLCHSMREEPAQTSAPHPCLPTLLVPHHNFPPITRSKGNKEAERGLLRHGSHRGAGICCSNTFLTDILSPLSKSAGEEGMLIYLAFILGCREERAAS